MHGCHTLLFIIRNVTVDERELAWEPRGSPLSEDEATEPGYEE
jgi:hypothetical protein